VQDDGVRQSDIRVLNTPVLELRREVVENGFEALLLLRGERTGYLIKDPLEGLLGVLDGPIVPVGEGLAESLLLGGETDVVSDTRDLPAELRVREQAARDLSDDPMRSTSGCRIGRRGGAHEGSHRPSQRS